MDSDRPPENKAKESRVRRKLKDLFVSSPPLEDRVSDKRYEEQEHEEQEEVGLLPETGSVGGGNSGGTGFTARRVGSGSLRPITATFRYRLLRRAWRPVLVTIPE